MIFQKESIELSPRPTNKFGPSKFLSMCASQTQRIYICFISQLLGNIPGECRSIDAEEIQ